MKSAVVAILAGLFVVGCAKASKEDCEKFAEHTIDLGLKESGAELPEELMKAAKDEAMKEKGSIVAECEGKIAKSEIDCALAAKSMDELTKCGN